MLCESSPRIEYYPNFLTQGEAEQMLAMAYTHVQPAEEDEEEEEDEEVEDGDGVEEEAAEEEEEEEEEERDERAAPFIH